MTSCTGAAHRCPHCGAGANWTRPLRADEGNGAERLLFCAECGTLLGEERDWHALGRGQSDAGRETWRAEQWRRQYEAARRLES